MAFVVDEPVEKNTYWFPVEVALMCLQSLKVFFRPFVWVGCAKKTQALAFLVRVFSELSGIVPGQPVWVFWPYRPCLSGLRFVFGLFEGFVSSVLSVGCTKTNMRSVAAGVSFSGRGCFQNFLE